MAFSYGQSIELCVMHQNRNVHTLNATMVLLWLIKITAISRNTQFFK